MFSSASLRLIAFCLAAVPALAFAQDQNAQAAPAEPFKPYSGQPGKDVVWVPTPQLAVDKMMELTKVTAKDVVMDLGSGDGRTVITAAKLGARAIGIGRRRGVTGHRGGAGVAVIALCHAPISSRSHAESPTTSAEAKIVPTTLCITPRSPCSRFPLPATPAPWYADAPVPSETAVELPVVVAAVPGLRPQIEYLTHRDTVADLQSQAVAPGQ